MHGTFVAAGPGIRNRGPVAGIKAIDVAPTLAFLMGIPGPQTAQGRILFEVLEGGSRYFDAHLLGINDFHGNLTGAGQIYTDPYSGFRGAAGGAAVLAQLPAGAQAGQPRHHPAGPLRRHDRGQPARVGPAPGRADHPRPQRDRLRRRHPRQPRVRRGPGRAAAGAQRRPVQVPAGQHLRGPGLPAGVGQHRRRRHQGADLRALPDQAGQGRPDRLHRRHHHHHPDHRRAGGGRGPGVPGRGRGGQQLRARAQGQGRRGDGAADPRGRHPGPVPLRHHLAPDQRRHPGPRPRGRRGHGRALPHRPELAGRRAPGRAGVVVRAGVRGRPPDPRLQDQGRRGGLGHPAGGLVLQPARHRRPGPRRGRGPGRSRRSSTTPSSRSRRWSTGSSTSPPPTCWPAATAGPTRPASRRSAT